MHSCWYKPPPKWQSVFLKPLIWYQDTIDNFQGAFWTIKEFIWPSLRYAHVWVYEFYSSSSIMQIWKLFNFLWHKIQTGRKVVSISPCVSALTLWTCCCWKSSSRQRLNSARGAAHILRLSTFRTECINKSCWRLEWHASEGGDTSFQPRRHRAGIATFLRAPAAPMAPSWLALAERTKFLYAPRRPPHISTICWFYFI